MARSKKQALYFVKQAQEVAKDEGFPEVAKSMKKLRLKLEEEVLEES